MGRECAPVTNDKKFLRCCPFSFVIAVRRYTNGADSDVYPCLASTNFDR